MTRSFALRALVVLLGCGPAWLVATGCGGQVSGIDPDGGGGGGPGPGPSSLTCAQVCATLPPTCSTFGPPGCVQSCEMAQQLCTTAAAAASFQQQLGCITSATFTCVNGNPQPTNLQSFEQCVTQAGNGCGGNNVMPGPGPGPPPPPPPPPTPGPPSCTSVCTRFQQQCGAEPQCLSQCEMTAKQCAAVGETATFDGLLACVQIVPLTCGSMGTATPDGCVSQATLVENACGLMAQDGGVMVTDAGGGPD